MFQLPELGLLSLAMAIPLVSGGLNLGDHCHGEPGSLADGLDINESRCRPLRAGECWRCGSLPPLPPAFLLCLAIGLLTGVIVAVIGVHPILVTLGTQTLITGISIWLTHGRTLSGFPEPLLLISNETFLGSQSLSSYS